jgi:outer membrane protein assembly factor BamD (BamD/ComL family)
MARRKGRFLFFGGFKAPERAIPLFESILKHAPRWNGAPEAQYLIGVANEMIDELELAIVAYMNTQHRYPDSTFAEKSGFGRAHCLYLLSQESPNDEETMEQAYAAAVVFLNTYPSSDHAEVARTYRDSLLRKRAEASYNRGVFYDKVARQPKAAMTCYQNFVSMFPNSEWTPVARARMDQLRPLVEKLAEKEKKK